VSRLTGPSQYSSHLAGLRLRKRSDLGAEMQLSIPWAGHGIELHAVADVEKSANKSGADSGRRLTTE
jgi:hypothetical protein